MKRSSELMGTIGVCFDVWSIWALFKIDRHEKAERSLLSSLIVGRLSCQATYEDMNGVVPSTVLKYFGMYMRFEIDKCFCYDA